MEEVYTEFMPTRNASVHYHMPLYHSVIVCDTIVTIAIRAIMALDLVITVNSTATVTATITYEFSERPSSTIFVQNNGPGYH